MAQQIALNLYPTVTDKVWRRLRDLPHHLATVRDHAFPGEFARLHDKVKPYTMCGRARLRGLYRAINEIVQRDIPGDIVECGTARGGSAALMALTLQRLGSKRPLWIFDTFEGMPNPSQADPDYEIAQGFVGACCGSIDEVTELFRRWQILDDACLVKGLFQETLPLAKVNNIAVLHLDCDWYESLMCCLDHFYDRLSAGAIIQVDDYGHWAGARKAVVDFLRRRQIRVSLRYLDYSGRQMVKPRVKPGELR